MRQPDPTDFSAITISRLAGPISRSDTRPGAWEELGRDSQVPGNQRMSKRHGLAGSWSVKLLVATAVIALGVLMVWGILAGRNEAATEAERERAIKVPIRVSSENDEPLI